jgi:hypothetical protein
MKLSAGVTAPVEMRFADYYVAGVKPDDSGLLAWVPDNSSAYIAALWSVPLPAGDPRRLGNFETVSVGMFPDGRIVYSQMVQGTDSKGADIRTDWLIADDDGANPRILVSFPGLPREVAVAPDGQGILLTQEVNGNRKLFEITPAGTGLREILKLKNNECCFQWTRDERYLVYQTGPDQQTDIWLMPMKTGLFRRPGHPIRLTNGPLPYSYPYPSADGKEIFVLGTKQRGQLVRYDMKSGQFVPFLSGISATDPTFSRDGKWVAYVAYPDHTLWRSRSDGSERLQLTYAPMDVQFPVISPDGTKVSFHTSEKKVFVISMEGGTPQKVSDCGNYASWSPDGKYLFDVIPIPPNDLQIIDVGTGKISVIHSPQTSTGFWIDQNTLAGPGPNDTDFTAFNLKTGKVTALGPKNLGAIVNFMMSPDGKYLYFTLGGADAKVERIRIADQQLEPVTSLKGFHRVLNGGTTQINVAPDGSPIFTRDTGYQEVYGLKIRWP